MLKLRYLLIFMAILVILLNGCSKNKEVFTVGLNGVFTLGIGQSAQITGEDIKVTFVEIIGDSRCPQNVNCVWAGVAGSHVMINRQGIDYSLVLNQPGLTEQAKENFFDYTITFSLNPYPREGEELSPEDYRQTLTFTK